MGTFALNQVYDFDYAGLDQESNDDVYINLKYQSQTTLPGFEQWNFRVKAFVFQSYIPPEDFPKKIRCFVKGLTSHRFIPDLDEQFPALVQDRDWLLPQVYVPGFTYSFTVTGQDASGKYTLKDIKNGLDHYNYESLVPLNIGDNLPLVVQNIAARGLTLASNRYDAIIGANFKTGQKQTFIIRKEKQDDQNRRFLQLVDKFRGFWHRFYLDDDDVLPERDDLELEIGEITREGWLCLHYPGTHLKDIQKIRLAENTDFGREDEKREFKSSILFAPGESNRPSFDKQLRHNIMREIASFLNGTGGIVYIGVNDAGEVSGIENDLPYLNDDGKDPYNTQYVNSTDGYELKIRNNISFELNDFASSLITFRFFKVDDLNSKKPRQKVFCEIDVKPASSPVYCHGSALFVRTGNSCRQLKNGDITSYILDRMRNQHAQIMTTATTTPAPAPPLKLAEDVKASELKEDMLLNVPTEKPVINWGCLSLFTDGTQQFGKPLQDPDLIASVQLTQKHRQAKYRLIQCYASGNVNAVKNLVDNLPVKKNQRYKNGWNTQDRLLAVMACHSNDYLILRSIDKDGVPRIKAIQVAEIGAHDSMTAQGNALLPETEAQVTGFQLVPERLNSFIYDIVAKGRYSGPGQNATLLRFQDCLTFLDKQLANTLETPTATA